MTDLMPFKIGDVMWSAGHYPREQTVPCPVCFGQLAIVVVLGNLDRVGINCEGCGKGFDGPRGTVREYVYEPRVTRFEIYSLESMYNGRWTVRSTTGATEPWGDLCATEADALAKAQQLCKDQLERNMASRNRVRGQIKESGWTVRYHRDQIKDLERQLAWHRAHIEAKSKKVG